MKIMVVEDDVMYRYAVRTILNWEEYGYRIIAEAINGRDALEQINREKPDIILTDISMPEMNGIELIKRVKSVYPDIKFIVLSNYDDFSFVKEAMKLGAEEYFLKLELSEEELLRTIEKVKQKIQNEIKNERQQHIIHSTARDDFFKKLFNGIIRRQDEIFMNLDMLNLDLKYSRLVIGLIEAWPVQACPEFRRLMEEMVTGFVYNCIVVQLENNLFAAVFNIANEKSEAKINKDISSLSHCIHKRLKELLQGEIFIGISTICEKIENLQQAWQQTQVCLQEAFYKGHDRIAFYHDIAPFQVQFKEKYDFIKAVKDLIEANTNETDIKNEIDTYMGMLIYSHLHVEKLKQHMLEVLTGLFLMAQSRNIEAGRLAETDLLPVEIINRLNTLEEYKQLVIRLVLNLHRILSLSKFTGNREIGKVISYIQQNYHREITISLIAEELQLSPNYLSSLFRQETGYRFVEYLNRVRIEEAKKILKNSQLKVYDVSKRVGFSNMPYFCTVFKEITGQTISDYKNNT